MQTLREFLEVLSCIVPYFVGFGILALITTIALNNKKFYKLISKIFN